MAPVAFIITAVILGVCVFSTGCAAYFNQLGHYWSGGAFGVEAIIMAALFARMVMAILDEYIPDTDAHTQQ